METGKTMPMRLELCRIIRKKGWSGTAYKQIFHCVAKLKNISQMELAAEEAITILQKAKTEQQAIAYVLRIVDEILESGE